MNMLFLNRREITNRLAETQREKKSNLIVLVNEWRNECRDGMLLVETIRSVHLFLSPTTTVGALARPGSGGDVAESGGGDGAHAHAGAQQQYYIGVYYPAESELRPKSPSVAYLQALMKKQTLKMKQQLMHQAIQNKGLRLQ